MGFVTLLHGLDFVSLSLALFVGFDGLIDPLFDHGAREVVDAEHESESVG